MLGRPLYAELSPVTDFREACCRQHEVAECNRGGFCNFMHLRHPTRSLKRELMDAQRASIREKEREERHRRREEHAEEKDDHYHRRRSSSRRRDDDRYRDSERHRRHRYDDY